THRPVGTSQRGRLPPLQSASDAQPHWCVLGAQAGPADAAEQSDADAQPHFWEARHLPPAGVAAQVASEAQPHNRPGRMHTAPIEENRLQSPSVAQSTQQRVTGSQTPKPQSERQRHPLPPPDPPKEPPPPPIPVLPPLPRPAAPALPPGPPP